MAKLHDYYRDQVVNELKNKFGYKSVMQVPRIEKIVIADQILHSIEGKP